MDLIFFGMQGSGKGTLGRVVAEKYGMQIFETGGELRKLAKEKSELGRKIKSIIEAGHLVSNEVVMEIVENFMTSNKNDSPILFDGIPRSLEQAKTLNQLLEKHNRKYTGVILNIEKTTALQRLTTRRVCKECKRVYPIMYTEEKCECGGELVTRADDNPKSIEIRLDNFFKETVPAIEVYKETLIEIDAEQSIEKVKESAFKKLDSFYK